MWVSQKSWAAGCKHNLIFSPFWTNTMYVISSTTVDYIISSIYCYYPNAVSNIQITQGNIQIMSTNILQRYCTVGFLTGLEKLWQPHGTTTVENMIVHSVERNLIDRFFSTNQNTSLHSSRIMPHILPAFFSFRYVYIIHCQNSWIINNLLGTFYSSLPCGQILHDS